jgi:hypothetical protein
MPFTGLVLLAAAHAFDYVSFLVMTAKHGLVAELNPVVVMLAEQYGLAGLTLAKLASVVLLAWVFVVLRPHRTRWAASILTIGITVGLVGGFSNVLSI